MQGPEIYLIDAFPPILYYNNEELVNYVAFELHQFNKIPFDLITDEMYQYAKNNNMTDSLPFQYLIEISN